MIPVRIRPGRPLQATTSLRGWRRLPAYLVNGISVALGLALIQLLFGALGGFHAAQLASTGAVCVSLADVPNTAGRAGRQMLLAVALSSVASFAVALLEPWPTALGVGIALIAFAAMMVLAWGPRAGPVSFAPVLALVFSMALPHGRDSVTELVGWSAAGALAYLAWALAFTALLQPRYRTLALAAAMAATARLLRDRAGVLERRGTDAAPRAAVASEAALAERLQAARDLHYAAPDTPAARRQTAILLRTIDLRDVLLASRLDVEPLGEGAAAQAAREQAAAGLRRIAFALERSGLALCAGSAPPPSPADALAGLPADAPRAVVERMRHLSDDVARIEALVHGGDEALPLDAAQLRRFVAPEGWPLSALGPHLSLRSPVLRHALRVGLALGSAYFIGRALPWASHPHWLVLSVAVVLRGNLQQTLSRRDARVFGTMLGCVVVLMLARLPSPVLLSAVFLLAAGTAHSFVTVRYVVTATAATVMALLQSHLVDPAAGFAVTERLADTLLGAALAWGFSYVLPAWERRTLPEAIRRALLALRQYARHTLTASAELAVEQRLARRRAYDALGAVTAALQRSGAEPKRVRVPVPEVLALLDQAHRLMAHLSMLRLMLARQGAVPPGASLRAAFEAVDAALAAPLGGQGEAVPRPAAPDALPDEAAAAPLFSRLQVTVQDGRAVQRAAIAALVALGAARATDRGP
jgi:uncharacterized membrane protein YccC